MFIATGSLTRMQTAPVERGAVHRTPERKMRKAEKRVNFI
jgi:hypothetical protein